jgi:predicted dehydrogenase
MDDRDAPVQGGEEGSPSGAFGTHRPGDEPAGGGVRWGIIGAGGIAARFAADIAVLPDAEVVAVGSRGGNRADAFAEEFGIARRYPSYAELVADPQVDAVYVATPHPFHREHALLAIAAGRPVLVEKPFTMDADQAAEVVAAARSAGVFCLEAMWTRFLPQHVELRRLLAEGAVGRIRVLHADQGMWFRPDPEHRLFAPELGGGALLDLGIYPFSFASLVLGTPCQVLAAASPAITGVDLTTSAVLTYDGGAHAVLTCTAGSHTPMRAWLAGDEGRIELDAPWYSHSGLTLIRRDGAVRRFDPPAGVVRDGAKGMRFMAAEVGRCLAAGLTESPVLPPAETVSIMRTLDEVRRQVGLSYASDAGTDRS